MFIDHFFDVMAAIEDECPVCHEPLINDLFTTQCEHTFHLGCLKPWVQKHLNCPICRAIVPALSQEQPVSKTTISNIPHFSIDQNFDFFDIDPDRDSEFIRELQCVFDQLEESQISQDVLSDDAFAAFIIKYPNYNTENIQHGIVKTGNLMLIPKEHPLADVSSWIFERYDLPEMPTVEDYAVCERVTGEMILDILVDMMKKHMTRVVS